LVEKSVQAKAAFTVDLVSETVDFASAAHRKAAAELLSLPPPAAGPTVQDGIWRS